MAGRRGPRLNSVGGLRDEAALRAHHALTNVETARRTFRERGAVPAATGLIRRSIGHNHRAIRFLTELRPGILVP